MPTQPESSIITELATRLMQIADPYRTGFVSAEDLAAAMRNVGLSIDVDLLQEIVETFSKISIESKNQNNFETSTFKDNKNIPHLNLENIIEILSLGSLSDVK